jgi:hypothetical protein
VNANPAPGRRFQPDAPIDPGGKPPRRKRSPAKPPLDVLEPAAGGPAPRRSHTGPNLLRQQISQQEWAYLESLPDRSLSEEIKLMRVLSLRLVQKGIQADNPSDEIRYYSEATRIMARLPQLLKAEQALESGQDELTQAMILAINAVLEGDQKKKARQLSLPLEDGDRDETGALKR